MAIKAKLKNPERLAAVARLACCVKGCRNKANVHHVRHFGQKEDDNKTIPLCHYHHQGKEGIHQMGRKRWAERFGLEDEMLTAIDTALKVRPTSRCGDLNSK